MKKINLHYSCFPLPLHPRNRHFFWAKVNKISCWLFLLRVKRCYGVNLLNLREKTMHQLHKMNIFMQDLLKLFISLHLLSSPNVKVVWSWNPLKFPLLIPLEMVERNVMRCDRTKWKIFFSKVALNRLICSDTLLFFPNNSGRMKNCNWVQHFQSSEACNIILKQWWKYWRRL